VINDASEKTPSTSIDSGNLLYLWHTVRKYWATALATTLAVALAVSFYTLGQTRIYEATSTIQFDPNPPRPLGKDVDTVVDMGVGSYWNNREYYETQYKVIQSMRVALEVVNELQLDRDPRFLLNVPANAQVPSIHRSAEDAAELLRSRVRVEPVKESRLAIVRLEDADPNRAQRILSTLVDVYVAQNLNESLTATTAAADWLRSQLDKLRTDLESSEMALHEYKRSKNILSVAFDDQSNMLRDEMKQINETLTHVRTRREEYAARVAELQRVSSDDPTNLPSTELLASPLLQELRQKYSDAVRDRQGLTGSGKGERHPDFLAAQQKVEATRGALLAEVRNIQGAVSRDLSVLQRQDAGLSKLFEDAKQQALELNLLEIEYKRLQRSKDNTEKLYGLVLEKTKESDLTRMLRVNNIRLVDRPLVPGFPVRPRIPINIAFGAVLGAVLGLLAALGRGALDRTVKTPDDIEQELKIPSLGLLPMVDRSTQRTTYGRRRREPSRSGEPQELVVHEQPMSGIAEAARAIRTNLLFMAPDKPIRTLLITSAGPSEGKTTVSCCVAIAMAQAGHRVLLIDCDLRRPRIHRIFGRSSEAGVTTSLLGNGETDSVFETHVPNLWITPAGPIPPNPAELLQSERFRAFLDRVAGRFDKVILDSPPVVAVTDAAILSTLTDAGLLVVRGYHTRKDVARHAMRVLLDVGAKTAGAVLNAIDLSRHEYKSSYYYFNKREYYGESPATKSSGDDSSASTAAPN
jgi:capsular exopolysaccharide synthesis family protein